jgi:hypothetical protein
MSTKHRRGLKDFCPQNDRDLGTKGMQAYKDLGFSWADELLSDLQKHNRSAIGGPTEPQKSIQDLEKEVWEAFDTLLCLAASTPNPDCFEAVVFMDDFYKPVTVQQEDDFDAIEYV